MKLEETAPLARFAGTMLALMFVVSGAVRAEPVFSFDATPGKLPKTVVPTSYSIELRPDAESLALPGVEVIDVEVREPTARLTLNAVNTTFASVTADDSAERADVALDAAAETATFTFARPLAAGAGNDRDLRRPQDPRAAGDQCLDQGAQMIAPFARFLRSVALHRHSR